MCGFIPPSRVNAIKFGLDEIFEYLSTIFIKNSVNISAHKTANHAMAEGHWLRDWGKIRQTNFIIELDIKPIIMTTFLYYSKIKTYRCNNKRNLYIFYMNFLKLMVK